MKRFFLNTTSQQALLKRILLVCVFLIVAMQSVLNIFLFFRLPPLKLTTTLTLAKNQPRPWPESNSHPKPNYSQTLSCLSITLSDVTLGALEADLLDRKVLGSVIYKSFFLSIPSTKLSIQFFSSFSGDRNSDINRHFFLSLSLTIISNRLCGLGTWLAVHSAACLINCKCH